MRFSIASLLTLFLATFSLVLSAPVPEMGGQYSGKGTWFDVGLGKCGETNVPSDFIVALATTTYADGAHCNKARSINVLITDKTSKKTAIATVRDSCANCAPGDLDMSTGLFETFAGLDVGALDITWNFE